jgi:hypothetical protein
MNETEMRQDLEKAVISLRNLRQVAKGERAPNATQDNIIDGFLKRMEVQYGITAKSWPKNKELAAGNE